MSPVSRSAGPVTLLAAAASLLATAAAPGASIEVGDVPSMRAAVAGAVPGDEIVLRPGDYAVDSVIHCDRPGSPGSPITVRASFPGCARLLVSSVEGFKVSAPWWTFEGLEMEGVCPDHSACEHAFHIVGEADDTTVRGCRLHEFNAEIKGNGEDPGTGMVWPDDVVVEGTELFNSGPRMTSNPVTPLDVVGGRRWIVRRNFIHDFQKGGGDGVSYGAFLKGNGRDGLFEGNAVACIWNGTGTGGTRVGLSFGGGGSGPPSICEDSNCDIEHQRGVMRNNIVVNCSDVGIYLNEALDCKVLHNTLYTLDDGFGIDVRFAASQVEVRNNLLNGPIRERDGGTAILGVNVRSVGRAALDSWFADPGSLDLTLVGDGSSFVDQGETGTGVGDDFCGRARDPRPDIGAVEYGPGACETASALDLLVPPPSGPPAGPGPSLRVSRTSAGGAVLLSWAPSADSWWNLYRSTDAAGARTSLWTPLVGAPRFTDADPLPGARLVHYVVRAVAPCTGVEAQ